MTRHLRQKLKSEISKSTQQLVLYIYISPDMDALLASAGPLNPGKKRRLQAAPRKSQSHKNTQYGEEKIDPSLYSILDSTRGPASYAAHNLATGSAEPAIQVNKLVARINDKKLRAKVARTDVSNKRAQKERADVDEWLNAPISGGQGGIEVDEEEGERTWRVRQDEIVKEVGVASGSKRFDLKFENMGTYKVDYTRNGR